ncbi:hypothetical protein BU198_13295 [Streptomyces sp. CBMA156]|nr:hypothetical protein [Streptomyces sp. CBMA156]
MEHILRTCPDSTKALSNPLRLGLAGFSGEVPRTICASDGCFNGRAGRAPAGWRCDKCVKAEKKHSDVHRRYFGVRPDDGIEL